MIIFIELVGEIMYFVYSSWYIVMAILLVGIIGLIVAFVMMDKKDRTIIQEFVNNSGSVQTPVDDEQIKSEESNTHNGKENK